MAVEELTQEEVEEREGLARKEAYHAGVAYAEMPAPDSGGGSTPDAGSDAGAGSDPAAGDQGTGDVAPGDSTGDTGGGGDSTSED